VANVDVQDATERYFARIHRAALILTGNPWDADDLAQETFLELARLAHRYEGRSSLYTWIYGILLNLERRQRRRAGLWRRKLQVLWGFETKGEKTSPPAESRIEVEEWKQRDPIATFSARLVAADVVGEDEIESMWEFARDETEEAVEAADAAPLEPIDSLEDHVLASEEVGS